VNLPPVIGIYAPAPQSGKSTIAQHLIFHHGYTLLPYAGPLKRLAITFLEQFGISHDTAYDYVHFNKNLIIPEVGVTARHILRSLGTEWGRTCIHPDVWLRAFNQAITQLPPHTLIVVDDVRRYNEAVNLLERHNAMLLHISCPGVPNDNSHASEGDLNDHLQLFDAFIVNSGTIADLHARVDTVLSPVAA
jgi:hypothetical protein